MSEEKDKKKTNWPLFAEIAIIVATTAKTVIEVIDKVTNSNDKK
jgi:hypothetical protein